MADPPGPLTGPDTAFARSPLWPLLAGGTGAFLWVQTSFGAGAGLLAGVPDRNHVLACAVAAVVLALGLWLRNAATLLFVFPAALLAAIETMPPEVRTSTFSAVRWTPWVVTLVGYVVAAGAWLSGAGLARREPWPVSEAPVALRAPGAYVWLRVAAAVLLVLAPAVWLTLRAPERTWSPVPQSATAFAHLALLFGGLIAVHANFVAPMLDAERDRKRLLARRDAPVSRWRRIRGRLGWLVLALAVAAALAALAYRR